MATPPGPGAIEVVEWGRARLGDLHALAARALPDERLATDDLEGVCFDGAWPDGAPSVVLASVGGEAALSLVARPNDGGTDAFVNLLVVDPAHRRRGLGRALLVAAEAHARRWGASRLRLAGAPPFYLWPGVDEAWTDALALARAGGFADEGEALDMALPSSTRVDPPAGVTCRGVLDEVDVAAVRTLVEREWPHWWPEVHRGIESAACIGAFDDAAGPGAPALAFCCHSVNRHGWLGPVGTDPAQRGRGLGSAVVGAVCRDLGVAGVAEVEVCWIGPEAFYASLGGTLSRRYRLLGKALSPLA